MVVGGASEAVARQPQTAGTARLPLTDPLRVPAAASNDDAQALPGTEALEMKNLSIGSVPPPQVGVGRDPFANLTNPVPTSIPAALSDPAATSFSSVLPELQSIPSTQVRFAPNLNARELASPAALVSPARKLDEDLSRCISPPPFVTFDPVAAPGFGLAPQPVQHTPPQSERYSNHTASSYQTGFGANPAAAPSSAFPSAPTTGTLSSEHNSWYSAPMEFEPGYSSIRSLGPLLEGSIPTPGPPIPPYRPAPKPVALTPTHQFTEMPEDPNEEIVEL